MDPQGPFVVVLNPGSGRADAAQTEAAIAQGLAAGPRPVEWRRIEEPRRIEALADEAAARAAAAGGVVVGVGGDGTLNAVARAALRHRIPFGAVPRGTFNYFGRGHGIPEDVEGAVRTLLDARPCPVQVGRVNGQPFLVNAGLGLYPKMLEDRETFKRQHGRSRAAAFASGVLTLLRERHQLRLRIETDAGPCERRTPTLFVGNNALQLEQVGVAEAQAVQQGRLAALVVRPISSLAMLGLALRGALGRLGEAEQVETFAFRRMEVDPVGFRRIKVAIDGEVRRLVAPLRFDTAPQPLWLMLPARAPECRG